MRGHRAIWSSLAAVSGVLFVVVLVAAPNASAALLFGNYNPPYNGSAIGWSITNSNPACGQTATTTFAPVARTGQWPSGGNGAYANCVNEVVKVFTEGSLLMGPGGFPGTPRFVNVGGTFGIQAWVYASVSCVGQSLANTADVWANLTMNIEDMSTKTNLSATNVPLAAIGAWQASCTVAPTISHAVSYVGMTPAVPLFVLGTAPLGYDVWVNIELTSLANVVEGGTAVACAEFPVNYLAYCSGSGIITAVNQIQIS